MMSLSLFVLPARGKNIPLCGAKDGIEKTVCPVSPNIPSDFSLRPQNTRAARHALQRIDQLIDLFIERAFFVQRFLNGHMEGTPVLYADHLIADPVLQ